METVADYVKTPVLIIDATASVQETADMMKTYEVGSLIVC